MMRLNEPDRARQNISLTPLIDIVFLLLVFFMLASTFLKFGTVKLETTGSGNSVVDADKIVLVHVDKARSYKVNGAPAKGEELVNIVNRLVDQGARNVVVIVRNDAAVDDLVNAMRKLRQSSASSVRIVE